MEWGISKREEEREREEQINRVGGRVWVRIRNGMGGKSDHV